MGDFLATGVLLLTTISINATSNIIFYNREDDFDEF